MNPAGCTYLSVLQILLIALLLGFAAGHNLQAMERPLIASLSSQHSQHYFQVIESFEQQVTETFPEVEFIRYSLQKKPQASSQILQEINEQRSAFLLTLGSRATRAGLNSVPDVPLVAAMILNTNSLPGSHRPGSRPGHSMPLPGTTRIWAGSAA